MDLFQEQIHVNQLDLSHFHRQFHCIQIMKRSKIHFYFMIYGSSSTSTGSLILTTPIGIISENKEDDAWSDDFKDDDDDEYDGDDNNKHISSKSALAHKFVFGNKNDII